MNTRIDDKLNEPHDVRRKLLATMMREKVAKETQEFPLSSGQEALWFLHHSSPRSFAYHVAFCVRVRSSLDDDLMRRALQTLVDRHAALRTTFHTGREGAVQRVSGYVPVAFDVTDAVFDEEEMFSRARESYEKAFDLESGPLFRASLFRRSDEDSLLLLTVHHLVFDGWSLWKIVDELGQLYEGKLEKRAVKLPEIKSSYKDHIFAQREISCSAIGERLWEYWQRELIGEPPLLKLPSELTRPPIQTFNGASRSVAADPELSTRLRELARRRGVTPYVLLLSAFQVLLYRFSGQSDIWIGSPMAGREGNAFANTVGYFVNLVVIRSVLKTGTPFSSLLEVTQATALRAIEHQAMPFPLLVERLKPNRDPSHSPLFQASFVLQKDHSELAITSLLSADDGRQESWGSLRIEAVSFAQQEGQFDIELELLDGGVGGLFSGAFKYNTDVYDAASMEQLAESFIVLLNGIVDDDDCSIDALPLLTKGRRMALIKPSTIRTTPEEFDLLHRDFERHANCDANATALIFEGKSMSYGELNEKSNRLSHYLISLGVTREKRVGIAVERSFEMIIGILGILKAGGVYVPIDPSSPSDRIAFIIKDSATSVLLTQQNLISHLPTTDACVVMLDFDWPVIAHWPSTTLTYNASVEDLAYVIYTSGTTGKPKGVQVSHFNVSRLFYSTRHWYGFDATDVWPLFHSFAFDVSVWEIWGALIHGGRLVIVPQIMTRTPFEFVELVRKEKVTVLNQTPSAFRIFMEAETRAPLGENLSLRYVIFAGEALDVQILRGWMQRYGDARPQLINMYGITETTVHSTYRRIRIADLACAASMIGEPIPDLFIHLLDARLEPVPPGVAGEMYVGGSGVTCGYLNRPELNELRFLRNPFDGVSKQCLYRSGDSARYRSNGDIEYLGRLDTQVKIRGFRIELGEIEGALGQHEGVDSVVVRAHVDEQGDKRLVAYVVGRNGIVPNAAELRLYLGAKLPAYMVPSFFEAIDALPLTSNGKLDHRALPAPSLRREFSTPAARQPRDRFEQRLVTIWQDVLKTSPIDIDDNFFEIGGHSVLAVALIARIETEFGTLLPVSTLFHGPTIATLAEVLRSGVELGDESPLVPIRVNGKNAPIFCVAGGGGNVFYYYTLGHLLDSDRSIYGLQSLGLDGQRAPCTQVEDLAAECVAAIRSVQSQGPYWLAGHCFGSWVALDIARQLQDLGETVALLSVIDAPAPSQMLFSMERHSRRFEDHLMTFTGILAESSGVSLELSPRELAELPDDSSRLEAFGDMLRNAGLLPINAGTKSVEGLLNVFIANSSARYLPARTIRVPIAIFRASEFHPDYDYSPADDICTSSATSTLGWSAYSEGMVSVEQVPGNHISMMASPHVEGLAAALNKRIAAQEAEQVANQ